MRWRQLILAIAVLIAVSTFARADFVYNPSSGFSGVTADSPLTGNGTAGSHLACPTCTTTTPTTTFSTFGAAMNTPFTTGWTNTQGEFGFSLTGPVTFDHLCISVTTADGASNSDYGILSVAGALLADVGPAHLGSTGVSCAAAVQGVVTLPPGRYVFAVTNVSGNLRVGGRTAAPGDVLQWFSAATGAVTSGGQVVAISAPTLAPAFGNFPAFMLYQ